MKHRIVSMFAAAALVALPTFGAAVRVGPVVTSIDHTPAEQAAALDYWSRERIAAAPAVPMPVDLGKPQPDLAVAPAPSGPQGSALPGLADPDADRIAQNGYWRDWLLLEQDPDGPGPDDPQGTFGVYTRYDVNTVIALHNIYPHKWDGKFTSSGGSCSATVISGNNIVTAAHCVYNTSTNVFYTNKVFTPAFRNGSAPFGTFATRGCSVLTAWVNLTGNYSIATWARHDVAVCTLAPNSLGQTINSAVGWAGRLWNASNTQLVFNSGYPARIYTDALIPSGPGQYLRSCTAETALYTTDTLRGGCYWGRGISGGSWLVGYRPFVVTGQVNSVNSGLFIGQQNLYGARFTSNNIVPLCTVRGC